MDMMDAGRSATEREIAETIGQDLTDRLMKYFGGTTIYIPMAIADDHPICRALGREGADEVAAWGGGSRASIPKFSNAADMHRRVIQARRDGKQTVAQIALSNNLSERHVYRILRQAAPQLETKGEGHE